MNSTLKDAESVSRASKVPDIAALQKLYQSCSPIQPWGWNRLTDCENARLCLWAGQSADGRMWDENRPDGKPTLPWNGASDFRPLTIDDACDFLKSVLMQAARRALRVDSATDAKAGANARRYLNYLTHAKLIDSLWTQIELFCQYFVTYPIAALQVTWRFEICWRRRELTMADVEAWQAMGQGQMPAVGAVLDPTLEDMGVAILQQVYDAAARKYLPAWIELDIPELSAADAKRHLRELREEGRTKIKVPYVSANHPELVALKPWEDFVVPNNACDVQRSPVFVRHQQRLPELEQFAMLNEWPEKFLKAVQDKPGWSDWNMVRNQNAVWLGQYAWQSDAADPLFETLHCYNQTVDDEGVTERELTVFHPSVTGTKDAPLYGQHGVLDYDHGKTPLVVARFETLGKQLLAGRSLPEILSPFQAQIKQHIDLQTNASGLRGCPPIIQYKMGGGTAGYAPQQTSDNFGPFARYTSMSPAHDPKLMNVGAGGTFDSKSLLDLMQFYADRRAGRPRPDQAPQEAVAKLQETVSRAFTALSEAFQQMMQLTAQYLDPAAWQAIVGEDAEPLPRDPDAISGEFAHLIEFDVQTLDPEAMTAKLESFFKLAQNDKYGVFDMAELMSVGAEAIDPNLARRLVKNRKQATEEMRRRVKEDLTHMRAGLAPELVENDPTAGMQVEMMQQILSESPEMQMALAPKHPLFDQGFAERVQTWFQNRQQSVMQTGPNIQSGLTGVKVNSPGTQMPLPA